MNEWVSEWFEPRPVWLKLYSAALCRVPCGRILVNADGIDLQPKVGMSGEGTRYMHLRRSPELIHYRYKDMPRSAGKTAPIGAAQLGLRVSWEPGVLEGMTWWWVQGTPHWARTLDIGLFHAGGGLMFRVSAGSQQNMWRNLSRPQFPHLSFVCDFTAAAGWFRAWTGVRMPGFTLGVHHFLVVCLLGSPLSPPCLSFPICTMGRLIGCQGWMC